MRFDRPDSGYERVVTFDIETTHYKASLGEVVSVGFGIHDRGTPLDEAEFFTHHRTDRSEEALIRTAYHWLDGIEADCLVTFNGRYFDFPFCNERLEIQDVSIPEPRIHTDDLHIDLLEDDRKEIANQNGQKYPSLEEALEAYGETPEPQLWRGKPLTNTRFGEQLGPALIRAAEEDDQETADELTTTIDEYLEDDLRKNLRLFYYDIGEITPPAPTSD